MIRTCKCFVGCLLGYAAAAHGSPLTPQRISMNPATLQSGNAASDAPSLAADGRYVAFSSAANNLVTGYSGLTVGQIYLYDRQNDTLELISVATNGTAAANAQCTSPQVSSDGRYVSFVSSASNIDTEGAGMQTRHRSSYPRPPDEHNVSASNRMGRRGGGELHQRRQLRATDDERRWHTFWSDIGFGLAEHGADRCLRPARHNLPGRHRKRTRRDAGAAVRQRGDLRRR